VRQRLGPPDPPLYPLAGCRGKSGLARTGCPEGNRSGKAAWANNPGGGAAQARRHVKCNREQTSRWPGPLAPAQVMGERVG